jgi:predicted ribosomally synthesized peptide with nif11-like leader
MSKVSEFYEAVSKDETLQRRSKEWKDAHLAEVRERKEEGKLKGIVAFAKSEGYVFTEDELRDFIDSKQVSEEELKAVSGGSWDSFIDWLESVFC